MAWFLLGLALVAYAVEAVAFGGTVYSLTDNGGIGKIVLFAIVLVAVLLFTRYAAHVSVMQFLARYATQWRRTLAGFGFMAGATILVCIAGYLLLAGLGSVDWSPAAWQNLLDNAWRRIAVALLVALVLATAEEIVFRSFVLRYFRYSDTFWVTVSAVMVSSAIFSVSHLVALGGWYDVARVPLLFGLFTIGILLGTVYVATGSLACSIGVHFGLVGFKVILIKSKLLVLVPDWLVDERIDIRMVPAAWLTFLAMAAAIVYARRWLQERFRVETAMCPDGGGEFALAQPGLAAPASMTAR
jgi:membrane protease YdiL (CAAX protease family)